MTKSADAFRTISEAADTLATPAHVLRFWESRFSQIKPVKRVGGRRYYRPADIALLAGIKKLLHEDGLTIRGVQKILREKGARHIITLGGMTDDEADELAGVSVGASVGASIEAGGDRRPEAGPLPMEMDDPEAPLWPETPLLEAAPPGEALIPDPQDDPNLNHDITTEATPDASARRRAQSPGAAARAELGRERAAGRIPERGLTRGGLTPEIPPEGSVVPAAALLRAMTAYRASQRRDELRQIYDRLSALHARRAATGPTSVE